MTDSNIEPARATSLEGEAWEAWNASYSTNAHPTMRAVYRQLGRALYAQALQQRIDDAFARLDQQNAQLEALHYVPGGHDEVN